MKGNLKTLPIGTYNFEKLRRMNCVYVDKTARLVKLVEAGAWYFLSRPRRFGKSLTLSTLDALFGGKAELFRGLAAEAWAIEQAKHPAPVLRLDMSMMNVSDVAQFEGSLNSALTWRAEDAGVTLSSQQPSDKFQELIRALHRQGGPVVVLIDEYDKPILDKIGNLEAAEAMRDSLRTLYTVLKGCDEYLRFVMLTGISRFTKTGVFSAMNNLMDISMTESFGDVVGYTQEELERDFADWIDDTAGKMRLSRQELLMRMKDYYDGFCFDGTTRLYNPFSILNFFFNGRFSNYWYESGSPSFIVAYMKRHEILDPEAYRHLVVKESFASSQEIERARPESFLYQAGYLTIEKWEEQSLTLDYPNREVLDSIAGMYLEHVYNVEGYSSIGAQLWKALSNGEVTEAIRLYNTALASIPYQDLARRDESLYRSLFLMLLRGAGITAHGEVPTNRGRSDVLVLFPHRVVVLEFKLARSAGEIARLRDEGRKQIEEKGYAKPFDADRRAVTSAVVVIDLQKHEAAAC